MCVARGNGSEAFPWKGCSQASTAKWSVAVPMVQTVLTEVRNNYQINEILIINEILTKHNKTPIADNV